MGHKFRIGQFVRLAHPTMIEIRAGASNLHEVTRLMPEDQTGEVSYRIKSSVATERAVRESEIAAAEHRPAASL